MISKLPRWVWLGGCLLAFVGGMVNVVALLSFGRLPVSHMSGNTSELGIAITEGNAALLRKVAGISVSFLLGAMGSGALIRGESLKLGRRYSTALCLETAMLCVAINLLQHNFFAGVCLCAAACGLQNALASTYSGAIVRTTHVTGVFTDLGTILGQRVAGTPLDWRRLLLYLLLIGGFGAGGGASALLVPHLGYRTLLIPAGITGLLAMAYEIYRLRRADVVS